ncbi:MAG: cobalt transporter subunit CbtB [Ancylobacter novellus]|uniref:Cobalt transporter subunit CbtB n=1 Tax=Ancylobacter novellus TaxID=921 RepID=A0A2W5KDK5_ANCNO|nr:MAG: cobalt transporter subunit CbtB [Ancylobacter novellus]
MSNLNSAPDVRSIAVSPARLAPILSAFLLGVFVIAGAGFASTPALHNAAHDQRHSIGFPCH